MKYFKHLLLFMVLNFACWVIEAQSWQWAHNAGGPDFDYADKVRTDVNGNVIVSGGFWSPSITFGSTVLNNPGTAAVFVAKYDPSGNVLWAKGSSSTSQDEPMSMATDESGNIYICGYYNGSPSITFGSFTLSNAGEGNAFVVKYDPSGNVIWAKSAGGADYDEMESITVGNEGNILVAGIYSSPDFQIGGFTLNNTDGPNYQAFAAEYDTSGNVIWATSITGSDGASARGIGVDIHGNTFVAGSSASDTVYFGSSTALPVTPNNLFLAKFDANGNPLWTKATTGVGSVYNTTTAVAMDGNGNAFVTGEFSCTTQFGNLTPLVPITGPATSANTFLVKYDTNGNAVWAEGSSGASYYNAGIDAATDHSGNIYITGFYQYGSISFGGKTLPISGITSAFIVEYNPDGSVAQALTPTGQSLTTIIGNGIGVDASGDILVSGTFVNSAISFGSITIPNNGQYDAFVAKYGVPATQPDANFIASDTGVCAGSAVNFTDQSTGSPTTWLWTFTGAIPGTSSSPNPTVTYNQPGTYPVKLWVSNTSGVDSLTKTAYITVNPLPVAGGITGPAIVCAGSSVQLSDTGSSGSLQWQYSADGISFSTIAGDTTSTNNITALPDSAYYRVMATNGCGTDSSAVYQLPVDSLPVPVVTAADTIICSGDSTQVCTSTTYSSYLWNTSDTTHCTSATAAGGYWLTVTDANHCSAVSNHAQVSVYPVPSVSITVQGDTLSSFGQANYRWIKDGVPIDTATGAVYVAHQSGDYAVQVTDTNGCTTTSEAVTVTGLQELTGDEGISVYPNPNPVGSWQLVVDNELVGSELHVYDEEGRIVFYSIINNQKSAIQLEVPSGVYYLRISNDKVSAVRKLIKL